MTEKNAPTGRMLKNIRRRDFLSNIAIGAGAVIGASLPSVALGRAGDIGTAADAWAFLDRDREYLARHITPYLPDRIFDAHAHLYSQKHWAPDKVPGYLKDTPVDVDLAEYRRRIGDLHPDGRVKGGVFFGYAFDGDIIANNSFVADEVKKARGSDFRALSHMIVSPAMSPDYIRQEVRRSGFVGLKPYYLLAKTTGSVENALIEEFLPEEQVRVANEEKLTITLHIVRDRMLADAANQATIRRYCTRYPDVRIILAHSAGLNPLHTIEGIKALEGIGNLWFDTGAVCEPSGMEAVLEIFGHSRLVYGTDFWASHIRGRFVGIGDSVGLVSSGMRELAPPGPDQSVLAGLEVLNSVLEAMRRMGLADRQIEDVFYGNAGALFNFA